MITIFKELNCSFLVVLLQNFVIYLNNFMVQINKMIE